MRHGLGGLVPRLMLVLFAAAPATPSYAWDLYGKGTDTCDKFSAAVHGSPLGQVATLRAPGGPSWYGEGAVYAQWIQGYLSALNALSSGGPNQIEGQWSEIDGWIRTWCETHPTRKLEEAVGSFVISRLHQD